MELSARIPGMTEFCEDFTMTLTETVAAIKEWADEAEDGNYHDLCRVLEQLAAVVQSDLYPVIAPRVLYVIRDLDDFMPLARITVIPDR